MSRCTACLFQQVAALCAAAGAPLDAASGALLARSLAAAADAAGPAAASLIKSLATRAMSEAEYFSSGAPALGRALQCIPYNLP